MKIHGLATITGFAAALIFAAPAMAEAERKAGKVDKPTQRWESFENLDENRDDELTASEARENEELMERWDTYDKDRSGTVDRAEFSAFENEYEREYENEYGDENDDEYGREREREREREHQSDRGDNPTQRGEEMGE